jgi:hypothetical protein
MMKKMSLLLVVAFISFGLLSCSTTKITDSWQNQSYKGESFTNILVIGQFLDEEVCRMSELAMVRDLKQRGVNATAAYSILTAGGRSSLEAIEKAVAEHGFDGVMISKVSNQMEESSLDLNNACVSRWDSDYRQNQRYALSPCQVGSGMRTTSIFNLETDLYSVEDRALVVKLSSKISAVRPAYKLIKSFGEVVVSRLHSDGLLAKRPPGK